MDLFEEFWSALPTEMKRSKGLALKYWKKLSETWNEQEMLDQLKKAIELQVKHNHFRGNDGKNYWPHGSTWLSRRRWEDDLRISVIPEEDNAEPTELEQRHIEKIRRQSMEASRRVRKAREAREAAERADKQREIPRDWQAAREALRAIREGSGK